jgi:hypothetical protein
LQTLRGLERDLPNSVEVKFYTHENELYVLAKSEGRHQKEMAMRRKRLARLANQNIPFKLQGSGSLLFFPWWGGFETERK